MNRLSSETSPYLLQHQHNPVHWYPWCQEAFDKAKAEHKPILVSIGYSSCHWCHVMEQESFENEEVAAIMNNHFVNIKVDREEYPDIDHLYMDAVQAMTRSGGWPLNVFLTPDKKPFYGGTYFPPKRMHQRASWTETLLNVSQYFSQNRNEVELQANKLIDHLQSLTASSVATDSPNEISHEWVNEVSRKLMLQADRVEGGFGHAPKFPSTHTLNFLLNQYLLYADEEALQHVRLSLDKMAMGGIFDHLGGGFSRYSTDNQWIAPHFEKMLYDNALLIELYALAYHVTKNSLYLEVVESTVAWLEREMTSPEGGFYSAQDADSEGIEGKYYTWQSAELQERLGEHYAWFAAYYHVRPEGNWEHTNILYTTEENYWGLSDDQTLLLEMLKHQLLRHRSQRIKPLTDDKILLGWNALMNKALIKASMYCQNTRYQALAEKNMQFIQRHFQHEQGYWRSFNRGVAKINAYADDLAYWIDALIEIGKATGNVTYTIQAKTIMDYVWLNFKEPEQVLFRFAHKTFALTDFDKEEIYDGATPSSNAILCKSVNYLGIIFQNQAWQEQARRMRNRLHQHVTKYPSSFALWAIEGQKSAQEFIEIALSGKEASDWYRQLSLHTLWPQIYYIVGQNHQGELPSLPMPTDYEQTSAVLCRGTVCLPPMFNLNELMIKL